MTRRSATPRVKAGLAAMLSALCFSGCVRKTEEYIPVPSTLPLRVAAPTSRNSDAVRRDIAPVPGSTTTTTIAFAHGAVTVSGVVRDGEGNPVPDAVVVLSRVVGDQRAELRISANEDGRYVAPNIKGGVLELFAFKSPDLSAGDGKVIFASGNVKQDLVLGDFSDVEIRWSIGPNQPTLNWPTSLSLRLTVRRVDPDGVVRSAPLEGISTRIVALGALQPTGGTERLTDAEGLASFAMVCNGIGPATVQVFFATGEETVVEPRACQPPPTTAPPDSGVPATDETGAPISTAPGTTNPVAVRPPTQVSTVPSPAAATVVSTIPPIPVNG